MNDLEAARKAQMDAYRRYLRCAHAARERAINASTPDARRKALEQAEYFAGMAYHQVA